MGYTSLYRKFRPINFSEIVGQDHIVKTLKNQIIADRVGHAYLFNGGRGTGKTTVAKILARAVNCLNPQDGEPCNECEICKASLDGSLTDIVEMDAASNNSVEDIREIREAVNFLPTKAKYRVYIIDEVHMLSTGAFNALLKTLEEPPKHVKFILATTEPQKVPATILSRCQRFDFKRVPNNDIIKRLKIVSEKSNIDITEEALNLIAILAEGGMRDALSILERCNQDGEDKIDENKVRDLVGIPKITYIKQIIEGILNYDVINTLEIIKKVLDDGKDLDNLLWEMIKYVKDILLYKATNKTETYNEKEIEDIKKLSEKATEQELIDLICNLSEIENEMKLSTQKLIIFQTGIIKLCNKMDLNNENNSNNNLKIDPSLEARVKKIENFLQAGNFVIAKKTNNNKNENIKKISETKKENANNENIKNVKMQGKVQDYWPKLVKGFKNDGKMFMYMLLDGTIAKQVNDMTIEIEFPKGLNDVTRGVLENPINMQKLKNVIHIASGKEMQIKFVDLLPEKNKKSESSIESFAQNMEIPFKMVE